MNSQFDQKYWEDRWLNQQTGWDIGYASTPITEYFDRFGDKTARILIPGCGNAWEGEYLHKKGFTNVFLIDLSPTALNAFSKRNPDFPTENLIVGDFFEHDASYDFIIEQTFFCALAPTMRADYVGKVHDLLEADGRLVGLLFNIDFGNPHPPFGGDKTEYEGLFCRHFDLEILEESRNSIKPRLGSELFINFKKKS